MGNTKRKQTLHESILCMKKTLFILFLKKYKHPHNRLKNNLPPLKLKDMQKAKGNKGITVQAM